MLYLFHSYAPGDHMLRVQIAVTLCRLCSNDSAGLHRNCMPRRLAMLEACKLDTDTTCRAIT